MIPSWKKCRPPAPFFKNFVKRLWMKSVQLKTLHGFLSSQISATFRVLLTLFFDLFTHHDDSGSQETMLLRYQKLRSHLGKFVSKVQGQKRKSTRGKQESFFKSPVAADLIQERWVRESNHSHSKTRKRGGLGSWLKQKQNTQDIANQHKNQTNRNTKHATCQTSWQKRECFAKPCQQNLHISWKYRIANSNLTPYSICLRPFCRICLVHFLDMILSQLFPTHARWEDARKPLASGAVPSPENSAIEPLPGSSAFTSRDDAYMVQITWRWGPHFYCSATRKRLVCKI